MTGMWNAISIDTLFQNYQENCASLVYKAAFFMCLTAPIDDWKNGLQQTFILILLKTIKTPA